MANLVASYSEANQDGEVKLVAVHPGTVEGEYSSVGQSFRPSAKKKIVRADFYLKKIGNPVGVLKAILHFSSGQLDGWSMPGDIVFATSDSVDISTLGVVYSLVTFNFPVSEQYRMDGLDEIAYARYNIQCQVISGTVNGANYVSVGVVDFPAASYYTNLSYFPRGVPLDWDNAFNRDCCFYVYGEDYSDSATPDVLVGRPDWDEITAWSAGWSKIWVTDVAEAAGLAVKQLIGDNASRVEYIAGMDLGTMYLSAFGHGSDTVFAGQNNEIVFSKDDAETARISNSKHFNLGSCKSGVELAPFMNVSGAIGVHAYDDDWYMWWFSGDWPNSYAKYFFTAHYETDIRLLGGVSHGVAHAACVAKHDAYLADGDVPAIIKPELLLNRNGKMFCGDASSVINWSSIPAGRKGVMLLALS